MNRRICFSILCVALCAAQEIGLRSTAKLVVAPISVTTKDGKSVRGLTQDDLIVTDNNVPVKIHLDEVLVPISLAIVIQATPLSQPALDKLRKEVSLFGPAILGEKGEGAVLAFAREIRTLQPFTGDVSKIEKAIANLDSFDDGGSILDAASAGLKLLSGRSVRHRRVLLLISETHDRTSKSSLEEVVAQAQQVNATVYATTFSPTRTAFLARAPQYCDIKCRRCDCKNCGNHCDRENAKAAPTSQAGTMDLFALFREMKRLGNDNVARALSAASGGMASDVARKRGFEEALQRIGDDLHDQYVVDFPPSTAAGGEYHRIVVRVKGRDDLLVRHRPGYLN